MKNRYNILKSVLIVIFLFVSLSNSIVFAGEHVLIPKIGIVDWSDNSNHKVQNNTFDFDDDKSASLGFTYLYEFDNGFSVGGEVFSYKKDIVTTTNNSGDSDASHFYAIAQKIFSNDSVLRPFIGVGLGFASIKFDANINGEIADDYDDIASYFSYEIFTGVEYQFNDSIGLVLEYKYFNLDIDDDIAGKNINVKSDGDAFFVGVSIHL